MLAFEHWLSTPAGQYFVALEQNWFDQEVPDLFGFTAVQLGTQKINGLKESRIPHTAFAYPVDALNANTEPTSTSDLKPDLYLQLDDLPFETQSLDLLILPHVLEFAPDPHQLLREVERVLLPEGRVIITGFNPVSLWGLKHCLMRRWCPVWPAGCEPIHITRLKDWFKLLSLELESGRFSAYRLPSTREKILQRFGFMEKAGDRWWPVCGGAYYLTAVKRMHGMRLINPAFKDKKQQIKNLKPAAQKTF